MKDATCGSETVIQEERDEMKAKVGKDQIMQGHVG